MSINIKDYVRPPRSDEGLVGTQFKEQGVFVTSPNLSFVTSPLQGQRSIRMQRDRHFGEEDPLFFPQPFSNRVGHLSCIPYPSFDANNVHRIAWYIPTSQDFDTLPSTSPSHGLGTLSEDLRRRMRTATDGAIQRLHTHVADLRSDNKETTRLKQDRFLREYLFGMKFLNGRLSSPASFQEISMAFALCQRVYLEFVARFDWLTRYEGMVRDPPASRNKEVADVVGALTDHEEVAERLYLSGIPVWLVRPISKKDVFRVDKWIEFDNNANTRTLRGSGITLCLDDEQTAHDEVFNGLVGNLERYGKMAQFIQRFTTTNLVDRAPIFSGTGSVEEINQIPVILTYSKGKNCKAQAANTSSGERNKFLEVDSPIFPSRLVNWASACAMAGEGFDPNASAAQGYALPDPAFIAVSANEKTVAGFLTTWLRLRQVLVYRLMSPTFRPLPTRDWRSILGIEMHGLKADTRAATKRREQEQMLQKCLISGKMQGAIDLSNLGSAPVEWRGQTLQPFVMPPVPITKEVLWELHEINFRYELIAVDRAYYRGLSSAAERQQEVLATIHHFNAQIVPDTLDAGKEGFASTDSNTRRRALHDLYVVMEGWVGSLGELPRRLSDSVIKARLDIAETSTISTQEFNDLEYALIFHYVSVCRKVLDRAPILPH
ncbi:hypothetical protein V5O48_008073 [Marasmius crinis-equi]|uniref:Uncharacterized protein n=1 Tax=Marasmius crinis-equi TaxID=585013 RepID=A0ABR3FF11_9AGAR